MSNTATEHHQTGASAGSTKGTPHTKLDGVLAAAERRFASDPERAELLSRTRRFKASWIELAEALTTCQRSQRYNGWGYASFEEYYRKELHLKTSTVNKLVGTYAFLRKAAPEVLERDGVAHEFPSLQNIEFLRRAEQAATEGQVATDLFAEVRRAIIDENLPAGKVSRQFKETLFPSDIEQERQKRRKETVRLAQRLFEALSVLEGSVPKEVLARVQAAIDGLLRAVPEEAAPAHADGHSAEQAAGHAAEQAA
jgi:hypothetical protein